MADDSIRIRTTHDGTQAEASLNKLEAKVKSLGDTVVNRLEGAFLSLFSVEAVKKFIGALDQAITKAGELADKLRAGKATPEDVKKSGMSEQSLAFGDVARDVREGMKAQTTGASLGFLRKLISGFAFGTDAGRMWMLKDPQFALAARLGADDKLAKTMDPFQTGQSEIDRQYAIEDIIRREMSGPEATNGYLTGGRGIVGMSTLEDYRNALLKEQVDQLKEINRKLNPRASQLLERKSMFE